MEKHYNKYRKQYRFLTKKDNEESKIFWFNDNLEDRDEYIKSGNKSIHFTSKKYPYKHYLLLFFLWWFKTRYDVIKHNHAIISKVIGYLFKIIGIIATVLAIRWYIKN
jgi:hypothetical protein